jgi:hypothetical protein
MNADAILARLRQTLKIKPIADEMGVSKQRVHQIIRIDYPDFALKAFCDAEVARRIAVAPPCESFPQLSHTIGVSAGQAKRAAVALGRGPRKYKPYVKRAVAP